MATLIASLERSLQNCSLNQTSRSRSGLGRSSSSDSLEIIHHSNHHRHHIQDQSYNPRRPNSNDESLTNYCSNASSSDENSTFLELNSHISLPYHWEQCLDLKTGELYYINWSNGMKAKEDPRTTGTGDNGEEEDAGDDDEEEEESYHYDSESSSTESSPSTSNRNESYKSFKKQQPPHQQQELKQESVLVVAGCKSCLMYYMVPKHEEDCPKCSGQLLHFAANN